MTAKPSNLGLPQAGPQVVSLRRAVAAIVCAAALGLAPAAAPAADRLDRAAAALKREPLYVHPDLLWLMPEGGRGRVARALRGASEPLYVAVLPLLDEDESGGIDQRALEGLRRRVGRPGRYLLMNQQAAIGVRTADGKSLELPFELRFADEHDPLQPVPRLLEAIRLAPSAPEPVFGGGELPERPELLEKKPSSPPAWRDPLIAAGIGLAGGVAAFAGFVRVAGRRRGGRP
jgi:hypothetical protein